jgi:hypothetical protein
MFLECSGIQYIDVTGLTAVQMANEMFKNCKSIKYIDISNMTAIKTANYMFYGCDSMISATFGSKPYLTSCSTIFWACTSLMRVDLDGMVAVTTADSMFYYCYSLIEVSSTGFAKDVSSGVNLTDAFYYCESLTKINLPNTKIAGYIACDNSSSKISRLASLNFDTSNLTTGATISMTYCSLSADALNAFFTSLPTLSSGRTGYVKIRGCVGTSTCDKTIATNKGWTVTV